MHFRSQAAFFASLSGALFGALVCVPNAEAQTTSFSGFSNFTVNGNGSIASNVLTLTDNNPSEASSAFYNTKVNYATSFIANFTYTASGNKAADGFTFVLQNNASGTAALGQGGSGLGLNGMTPSAALEFNIYNVHSGSIAYSSTGTTGGYTTPGSVNIASGDSIAVTVQYSSALLTETLFDTTTSQSFSTSYSTNLSSVLGGGGLAYVGFTGADGGSTSTQKITGFSFSNAPEPVSLALLGLALGSVAVIRRPRPCL